MRSENVSPEEWRWVAIFSGILVAIMLIPYAWSLAVSDNQYAFMGILPNPQDGATYLSKIQQGREGHWLFEMRHSPHQHDPAGFHLFYLALGHLANLLGLSNVVIFHLARVLTSFFMLFSFYQLGASIWTRQRPRRLFFMLLAVGSGLGWLVLLFNDDAIAPDLKVPEGFPLLAAYTNPHFPLALGCMALLADLFITVFRPGFREAPTVDNGGLLVIMLTLVLTIVSPPGAIAMGGALALLILARGVRRRDIPYHEIRWAAMLVFPAAPIAFYYVLVFRFNETFQVFNEQNQTPSPNLLLFFFGYGLLLMVAIPGLIRAARRFEPDGDQFMLLWAVFSTLAIYAPGFALQRRMFIGLLIPIVYFAVRSLEDYWLERIPEKWRAPALIAMVVFILPTHLFTFGAPFAFAVVAREAGSENYVLLQTDYLDAFTWMDNNSQSEDVVLASELTGLWIPAKTHLRVVYGHPFETVPFAERGADVGAFYLGNDCEQAFNPAEPYSYEIQFVLWGPQEDRAGLPERDEDLPPGEQPERPATSDRCREWLEERAVDQRVFGDVTVYVMDTSR